MTVLVDDVSGEHEALLRFLEVGRASIRRCLAGLSAEQLSATPTASSLSLVGLLKHTALCERGWMARITGGEHAGSRDWSIEFTLVDGETPAAMLALLDEVARDTAQVLRSLPDLDRAVSMDQSRMFPPGTTRTVRWVLLHLITEQSRHAGHADLIRECLDGSTAPDLVAAERAGT